MSGRSRLMVRSPGVHLVGGCILFGSYISSVRCLWGEAIRSLSFVWIQLGLRILVDFVTVRDGEFFAGGGDEVFIINDNYRQTVRFDDVTLVVQTSSSEVAT